MTAGGSLQMSRSRLPWRVEIVTKWGGMSNLIGGEGGFLIRARGTLPWTGRADRGRGQDCSSW